MRTRTSSLRSRLVAALLGAGAMAALGGVAYATIPDSSGVIHTCYSQATGTWRPIDTEASTPQKCKSGEIQLDFNQRGPQGPAGPKGDTGAPGQPGTQGPVGPRGPSDAYATTTATQFLPWGPEARLMPVGALSLPAGSYVFSATVEMDSNVSAEVVSSGQSCQVDDSTETAGPLAASSHGFPPNDRGFSVRDTISINGAVTLATADVLHLSCISGPAATARSTGPNNFTAIQVGALNTQ